MSVPTEGSSAHHQLVAEAHAVLGRLRRSDGTVAGLLRLAANVTASAISQATRTPDRDRARHHWNRCAEGESAILVGVREAQRKRRITRVECQRVLDLVLRARRERGEAFAAAVAENPKHN